MKTNESLDPCLDCKTHPVNPGPSRWVVQNNDSLGALILGILTLILLIGWMRDRKQMMQ